MEAALVQAAGIMNEYESTWLITRACQVVSLYSRDKIFRDYFIILPCPVSEKDWRLSVDAEYEREGLW